MTSSLPGERNTGAPRPRKLLWLLLLLRVAGAAGLTVPAPRFPAGWDSVGLAPPSERLRVVFSLRQSREGLRYLAAELREIADPSNAERYGRWLTQAQVEAAVAPPGRAFDVVEEWIRANTGNSADVILARVGGDAVSVTASVAQIEKLFSNGVQLHRVVFSPATASRKTITKATLVRGYRLGDIIPDHILTVLDMISPIFSFIERRRPSKKQSKPRRPSGTIGGDPAIVPQTVKTLYNLGPTNRTHYAATTSNAVAEMQHSLGPEGFDKNDLNTYQKAMHLSDSLVPALVTGGHNDGIDPTGECTMDTDLVGALAQGNPTTFWFVDEWMYELGLTLSAAKTPPNVVSISWGFAETRQCGPTDFGPDMPANCTQLGILSNVSYVERTNTEFLKLSVRGVTLIVSSGDNGAPGDINSDCSSDDNITAALNPEFPASSPYVLSVGATMLGPNAEVFDPKATDTPTPCKPGFFWKGFRCAKNGTEIVATTGSGAKITSGGGFSTLSARPKWQDEVVKEYLAQNSGGLPPAGTFNSFNRAYPDVAAIGHNHLLYLKGTGTKGWDEFDGTSASAPIWAALVTRLNNARVAEGKSVLGFLPPLIYKFANEVPKGFHDMVKGDNKCTVASEGQGNQCCRYGFEASAGWDPVTGEFSGYSRGRDYEHFFFSRFSTFKRRQVS